jgi:hypothetical protein
LARLGLFATCRFNGHFRATEASRPFTLTSPPDPATKGRYGPFLNDCGPVLEGAPIGFWKPLASPSPPVQFGRRLARPSPSVQFGRRLASPSPPVQYGWGEMETLGRFRPYFLPKLNSQELFIVKFFWSFFILGPPVLENIVFFFVS